MLQHSLHCVNHATRLLRHHSIQRIGSSGLHAQDLQPCKVRLMGVRSGGCAERTYVHRQSLAAKSLLKTVIQLELGRLRTHNYQNSPFLWRLSYPRSTLHQNYTSDGTFPLAPPHCQPLYSPGEFPGCYNGCLQYTLDLCEGMQSLSCRPSVRVVCRCVRRRSQV